MSIIRDYLHLSVHYMLLPSHKYPLCMIHDSPSYTSPLYVIYLHLHVHHKWLTFTNMFGIKLFTFKYKSVIHNLPSSTCPLYIFTFRDMSIIHAYPGQKKPLFHTEKASSTPCNHQHYLTSQHIQVKSITWTYSLLLYYTKYSDSVMCTFFSSIR